MGFVQLLTQDEHGNLLEQLKHEQEDKRLKLIEEAKEEHKRAKEKERFELDQERERLAPKMTALNVFKKNAILIDAIVVEYKNRNLIVKPQIKGFEDQSYSIPYPNNDFGPGAVVQILMRLSKKKTLQHEGRPKLKK